MNLANCTCCGKLMIKRASLFCESCVEEHRGDINSVRHYLMMNPKATLLEVHEQTGMSLKMLSQLLKDRVIESRGFTWKVETDTYAARMR